MRITGCIMLTQFPVFIAHASHNERRRISCVFPSFDNRNSKATSTRPLSQNCLNLILAAVAQKNSNNSNVWSSFLVFSVASSPTPCFHIVFLLRLWDIPKCQALKCFFLACPFGNVLQQKFTFVVASIQTRYKDRNPYTHIVQYIWRASLI